MNTPPARAARPLSDRVLTRLLAHAVAHHPQRTFVQFDTGDVSYAEFDGLTQQVAAQLAAAGMKPGDKLAIMSRNRVEFLLAWFGAAKAGVLYVPINTDYKGPVLAWQLAQAGVTHMVLETEYLPRLQALRSELPLLRQLYLLGSMSESGDAAADAGWPHAPFTALLQPVVAPQPSLPDAPYAASHADPLAICFTSGTTGPSKGVLATHCHVVTFAQDWIRAVDFPDGGAIYTPLPLFHAIAAWLGVVPALLAGGRIAIAQRFSASNYWREAKAYDVDVVHGIFSMVPMLLKQPPRPDDGTQRARRFYIGRTEPEFERRFRCQPIEVFGATETGIVTMTPPGQRAPAGSCGKPNDATFEVMIANDNDEPVPAGEVGEILVRPRHPYAMFSGYHGAPQATCDAFRNQWFHTGDNARMDEDGWVYFVDRKKDAIRRRGENISSYEVENVLLRLPAVLECAAVAARSELGEDEVKAVIVLKPGTALSAEEVWAFCEAHMPRFWVPRYVEFRSELPKTANHKVQKHLLREPLPGLHIHERPANQETRR